MSLNIGDNFNFGGKKSLDGRQDQLTIASLKQLEESTIPNGFICFVEEDGNNYQYKESNEVDATLGRFRLFASDKTYDGGNAYTISHEETDRIIDGGNALIL